MKHTKGTTYIVTLAVIVGYKDSEKDIPDLRYDEYTVIAFSESDAKEKAKKLNQSKLSVWESFAEQG